MDLLHANFELAMPFHSRLRVRHGTDRRTDRRRPSMLNALWGRGIYIYITVAQFFLTIPLVSNPANKSPVLSLITDNVLYSVAGPGAYPTIPSIRSVNRNWPHSSRKKITSSEKAVVIRSVFSSQNGQKCVRAGIRGAGPRREAYSAPPDTLARLKGSVNEGREGEGNRGGEGEGIGRVGGRKGV